MQILYMPRLTACKKIEELAKEHRHKLPRKVALEIVNWIREEEKNGDN